MDGTLGSQTAWMLDGSGVVITSGEELAEIIRAGARAGWPVGVHAIGDRANREALDAFESTRRTGCPGLRQRIEHAQCLAPEDVARFAAIGVTCSVQFSHAPSDRDLAERFWADKADGAYAFRSLWDSGALVANGSDAPVEELDPLAGIRAGVLRTIDERPAWYLEQCLTIEEALLASTVNPAWLSGDERRRGKLSLVTSPISSSSRAIHSNACPTSSSPSKSWRRWSVDAGFTTHLPGPSRAADRPQGGAATLRRRSDCIRVGQAGACGAGLRAARRAVRPPSRHERPRDRPWGPDRRPPAARPRGEPARRPGARSSARRLPTTTVRRTCRSARSRSRIAEPRTSSISPSPRRRSTGSRRPVGWRTSCRRSDRTDGGRCRTSSVCPVTRTRHHGDAPFCSTASMRARPRARRGRPGPLALDTEARFAALEHAGFRATEHEVVTWDTHWDTDGIRALYGTFSPIARLDAERRDEILDVVRTSQSTNSVVASSERCSRRSTPPASPTDPSRGHPYTRSWPPARCFPSMRRRPVRWRRR